MIKAQRAQFVLEKLKSLYPNPPCPLDYTDSYTLLVAVLLSAQCTDKRVNLVTPILFARARTPNEMVKIPVDEIREIIKPCGLSPQKAKAISGLSQILLSEHNGQVPNSLEALEKLPGVGHKTAQVVMAEAFKVPSFPVDTHIHRLAHRWGLSDGKSVDRTERDLKSLFPISEWNSLHLQIIYYGREHCTAWSCDGTRCEICRTLYPNRKTPVAKSIRKPRPAVPKLESERDGKTKPAAKRNSSKPLRASAKTKKKAVLKIGTALRTK